MQAIILAGGLGTRLKPLTTFIPKPLVPIGEMPILEVVLRQLKYAGYNRIVLAVNHLSELIMAIFGDGKKYGLEITYSKEDKRLGTAGPIGLVENLEENFLVMNGDLLTTIDYKKLYDYHVKENKAATIATYKKKVKIDLGVLKIDKNKFIDYYEKPTYEYDVSMGIYILNKKVLKYIKKDRQYDMPELMLDLKKDNKDIFCYKGNYKWLDIGRMDDYEKAVEEFTKNKDLFLK